MLLAIYAGNTNIVLGVFDGETLVQSWRLQTLRERTSDELGLLVDGLFAHSKIERVQVRGVILGSVVPPLTPTLRAMTQRYFGVTALSIEPGVETGMPILYENPAEVGADRIVNGVAAYEKFKSAAIVVDFGTATTFDAISSKGEYMGGAIAPGLAISAEALFERAARLPRVDIRRPPKVIGRNTTHSLQAGLFYGYIALVQGILERMRQEMGEKVRTIGTGGLVSALEADLRAVLDDLDPNLTLEGLRIIHERNR